MRLLVLGGTKFLGRQVVQTALEFGHDVTVFNRGRTAPGLFGGVRELVGDRSTGDLAALNGGEWDGAVDFSGMMPSQVRDIARVLDGRVGHYVFMSTIGVYARHDLPGMTESAPLLTWVPDTPEMWSMQNYGPFKTGCEQVAAAEFPGRSSHVRSGFIIGPHGYDMGNWGERLAAGKDISCSLRPGHPIQVVDSRDLAEFMLRLIESGVDGPMNVVGSSITVRELAEAWVGCVPGTRLRWGSDGETLGLSGDPNDEGTFQISNARALAAGLRLRPMQETAHDYIEWIRAGGTPPPPPH